jgi:hypothetical protein
MQFLKADGTTPVLNIDTTNKRLGVGTTAPFVALHSSDGATVASGIKAFWNDASDMMISANQPTYGSGLRIAVAHDTTVTSRPLVTFVRTRGTLETPASVQLNDNLGDLLFGGASSDGSIAYGGGLFAYADGATTVGGVPTRLSFVSGNHSGDRKERLTIKANGEIRIAQPNPVLYYLIDGSTTPARSVIYGASSGSIYHTMNAYFDGSNWQRDDATKAAVFFSLDAGSATVLSRFRYAAAGANPITPLTAFQVSLTGVLQVPKLSPIADSTTAMQFFKADGTTAVATIDTTNSRVGIGTASPEFLLDVTGASAIGQFKRISSTANQGSGLLLARGGGTVASPANISAGFQLGKIQFRGRLGGAYTDYAGLVYIADGTTANDGHFAFTKDDLSTEVMTINSDDGKVGIGTGATISAQLHTISTTEQLRLGYDTSNYLSATVGSSNAVTLTNAVAADININCGTDKTVVLTETVWDDMRVNIGNLSRPGGSDPAWVAYDVNGGGVSTYLLEFAKNNYGTFTVQLPHSYKTGTDIYCHAHWTPGANGAAENGKTVGWKVEYSWANINGNFGTMASLDLSDACDGTNHKHQMTPDVVIDCHTAAKGISSMLICNIKRTDTGADDTWAGTAAGALPMLLEVDFHFEIDTVGSRQISAK